MKFGTLSVPSSSFEIVLVCEPTRLRCTEVADGVLSGGWEPSGPFLAW